MEFDDLGVDSRTIADSSSTCATTSSIQAPTCFILASPMQREVTAGVPICTSLGLKGLRGSSSWRG